MLTTISVQVPQEFGNLFAESGQTLYVEAMKDVVVRRLTSIETRVNELRTKIAAYEAKYRVAYADFAQQMPDSREAHDDWMEWSYLVKITQKLHQRLENLRLLAGVA